MEGGTLPLRKRFQIYSEQKQTGKENVTFLIFLEIDRYRQTL